MPLALIEPDGTGPASSAKGQSTLVRAESLRYFAELVEAKGLDPQPLFDEARIDRAAIVERDRMIPYRRMIELLEAAADRLGCPDFGLQLAQRQYAEGILGPLDIAMRNSHTVGDAWRYCVDHVHTYSPGAHLLLRKLPDSGRWMLHFEILLPRMYRQRQAVEHALLVSHLATRLLSGGQATTREVWLAHEPLESGQQHQECFGCKISFAQPCSALFFDEADFAAPVVDRDDRVLELAAYFIDSRFPSPETVIGTKVRIAIEQQLANGECTQSGIAATLGMHPRTLQRRLREEGLNFEAIRDDVRRDTAMRYLRQTRLPLKTIAGKLGYSELSVLYRSCHRWFGASPSSIRCNELPDTA